PTAMSLASWGWLPPKRSCVARGRCGWREAFEPTPAGGPSPPSTPSSGTSGTPETRARPRTSPLPPSAWLFWRMAGSQQESFPVQSKFRVEVSKDYLVFASAHFITFRGHQCESLHGHNYRVGVAVEGAVDSECLFVLDFSVLKRIVR